MRLYLIAVMICVGIIMAAAESYSHGNWSDEKEHPAFGYIYEIKEAGRSQMKDKNSSRVENGTHGVVEDRPVAEKRKDERILRNDGYEERNMSDSVIVKFNNNATYMDSQQLSKPLQPHNPEVEKNASAQETRPKSTHKALNDAFTISYSPAKEILEKPSPPLPSDYPNTQDNVSNPLSYAVSEEYDLENTGNFGQRVRSSLLHRIRFNGSPNRVKSTPLDDAAPTQELKKQHRGQDRPRGSQKKQNQSEIILNESTKLLPLADTYRTPPLPKFPEPQKAPKDEDVPEQHVALDYLKTTRAKSPSIPRTNDEDVHQSVERDYKPKKHRKPQENSTISENPTSTSTFLTPIGKFTGPIVVPDLPRYKKQYAVTTEDPESNDVASTPRTTYPTEYRPSESAKSRLQDTSYLTSSSAVLSPLQAGVALVNAGQVFDTDSERLRPLSDRNPDQEPREIPVHEDQELEQEQISEVVAPNSPSHSVEVQKSVEIYHTAPVQEIHYPIEYVPHGAQTSGKHRPAEISESKTGQRLGQVFLKDRRPTQGTLNVYKSNEISEETRPHSQHVSQNRYEYNVNENEVNKSPVSSPLMYVNANPINLTPPDFPNTQYRKPPREQDTGKELKPLYVTAKGTPVTFFRQEVDPPQTSQTIENPLPLINPDTVQNQEVPQYVYKLDQSPQTEPKHLIQTTQAYPIEKIVEKTIHVPHSVEVEKVIEKKVVYPVEKIIEKQVTLPQPFPVHIQVPVDRIVEKQIRIPQLYPVHIERVIEKKVPYAIQRFIIQHPHHAKAPQYPIEKSVHLPVQVDKVLEKVHVPRPYPIEIEKAIERRPFPIEVLKLIKPVHQLHNPYDVNYQGIRQQSFYQKPYGVSGNQSNSSQQYGHHYGGPSNRISSVRQQVHPSKKFGSYGVLYPQPVLVPYGTFNGNGIYGRHEEVEKVKDEYVGPVPRKIPASLGLHSKPQFTSGDIQTLATVTPLRRVRQDGNTGSFRQSKMEYGFKPPMVPSVQYDEKTASKVE